MRFEFPFGIDVSRIGQMSTVSGSFVPKDADPKHDAYIKTVKHKRIQMKLFVNGPLKRTIEPKTIDNKIAYEAVLKISWDAIDVGIRQAF